MRSGETSLLKNHSELSSEINPAKKGSSKPEFVSALSSGLNRRAFLRQSGAALLLTSIAACKPNISDNKDFDNKTSGSNFKSENSKTLSDIYIFDQHQKDLIIAVQLHLFPDDGDGPSATEINALKYLEWALTDPDNEDEGDGEFIVKGVGWLDSLSEQTQGDQFIKLSGEKQDKVLQQISKSSAGENWLSILIYYLIEALLFDPIYGGNPDGIGWKWLEHQPGFPAPTKDKLYRSFI